MWTLANDEEQRCEALLVTIQLRPPWVRVTRFRQPNGLVAWTSEDRRKRRETFLTLSTPGWGGFFNIWPSAMKLCQTFSEIYLGVIWCGRLVFIDFDVTMESNFCFDRQFWLFFVKFWRFPELWGKSRNPTWLFQDGRHLATMSLLPRHMTSLIAIEGWGESVPPPTPPHPHLPQKT